MSDAMQYALVIRDRIDMNRIVGYVTQTKTRAKRITRRHNAARSYQSVRAAYGDLRTMVAKMREADMDCVVDVVTYDSIIPLDVDAVTHAKVSNRRLTRYTPR